MSFKYDEKLDLYSWNSQTIIIEKIKPNSSVLEFGCANGRLTKHLNKEMGCKVTIVEIDEGSGKEASKYAKECFLGNERGNIEKYYWSEINEKFDYIVFADVLEHLYSPDKVLEQCKKVLKEDGLILISIPNVANYSIINQLLKGEFNYTEVGLLDNTHLRFFTKKPLKI
ncbi:methyltransferase domain protein [[Eubacterium] yurii subsp. margaretiae ATCC 43715]|nr:methyltransferase domain protein [[Eubacterium] yurii subsp. margaretiae ATCC 43715]